MSFLDTLIYGVRDLLSGEIATLLTRRSKVWFRTGFIATDDPTDHQTIVDVDALQFPEGMAANDMFYYDGTDLQRIPIGTDGQVLTIVDGIPVWGEGVPPEEPFDPATLPGSSATLLRWLEGDNLTQSGGNVTAIDDKSVNDIDPTINGGEEPLYIASESTFGNQPVWNLATGVARCIRYGTNHGLGSGAFTLVFVASANGPYVLSEANGNMYVYGQAGSGDKWGMTNNGGGQVINSTQAATTPAVVVCVFNGASSKMYVSKKTSPHTNGSFTANNDLTSSNMFLGNYSTPSSGNAQNGKEAVWSLYSGAMSESDIGYLLDGWGAKYGITITP